jgi:hypothetical protein
MHNEPNSRKNQQPPTSEKARKIGCKAEIGANALTGRAASLVKKRNVKILRLSIVLAIRLTCNVGIGCACSCHHDPALSGSGAVPGLRGTSNVNLVPSSGWHPNCEQMHRVNMTRCIHSVEPASKNSSIAGRKNDNRRGQVDKGDGKQSSWIKRDPCFAPCVVTKKRTPPRPENCTLCEDVWKRAVA